MESRISPAWITRAPAAGVKARGSAATFTVTVNNRIRCPGNQRIARAQVERGSACSSSPSHRWPWPSTRRKRVAHRHAPVVGPCPAIGNSEGVGVPGISLAEAPCWAHPMVRFAAAGGHLGVREGEVVVAPATTVMAAGVPLGCNWAWLSPAGGHSLTQRAVSCSRSQVSDRQAPRAAARRQKCQSEVAHKGECAVPPTVFFTTWIAPSWALVMMQVVVIPAATRDSGGGSVGCKWAGLHQPEGTGPHSRCSCRPRSGRETSGWPCWRSWSVRSARSCSQR